MVPLQTVPATRNYKIFNSLARAAQSQATPFLHAILELSDLPGGWGLRVFEHVIHCVAVCAPPCCKLAACREADLWPRL
jgi:hypothetical protein